jgi:hypothetical protein
MLKSIILFVATVLSLSAFAGTDSLKNEPYQLALGNGLYLEIPKDSTTILQAEVMYTVANTDTTASRFMIKADGSVVYQKLDKEDGSWNDWKPLLKGPFEGEILAMPINGRKYYIKKAK